MFDCKHDFLFRAGDAGARRRFWRPVGGGRGLPRQLRCRVRGLRCCGTAAAAATATLALDARLSPSPLRQTADTPKRPSNYYRYPCSRRRKE